MLTEQTIIKAVSVDTINSEACVITESQILRNNEVIFSNQDKRFFNSSEVAEFTALVPEAQSYITVLGW